MTNSTSNDRINTKSDADRASMEAAAKVAFKLKQENDAENAAKAEYTRSHAADISGYTPTYGSIEEVGQAARAALVTLKAAAVVQETSNFVPLALAFADYSALRLAATGAKVTEKDVKEFFAPIVKDFETGKRTIASYITLARKAGMLMASFNTTTVRQAWINIVPGKAIDISYDADKPAGKNWVRDIVGDISAYRPMVKSGKGKESFPTPRASAILPMGSTDINDAYARFIVGSPMTVYGTVDTEKAKGKGADTVVSAGLTEDMNVAGVNDADLLKAFVTMMKDKVRVAELIKSDAAMTDLFNAYLELDMHVTPDGEVLLKKDDSFDPLAPIVKKAA